ncbi:hypothetical protein L218DRAFT_950547 [Marasmius fiardii PR-910]|nr:hypothetical protein L218DRAFT_950547 [Marasmius fiardii PR-910]
MFGIRRSLSNPEVVVILHLWNHRQRLYPNEHPFRRAGIKTTPTRSRSDSDSPAASWYQTIQGFNCAHSQGNRRIDKPVHDWQTLFLAKEALDSHWDRFKLQGLNVDRRRLKQRCGRFEKPTLVESSHNQWEMTSDEGCVRDAEMKIKIYADEHRLPFLKREASGV